MENASKSLIIAASLVLGIIIISFLIFTFGSFKTFNKNQEEQLEENKNTSFNSNFFKYYENGTSNIELSSQDIISIANFVKENNLRYNLEKEENNSFYVKIDVYTKENKITNFENQTEEYYIEFIKNNKKVFKCSQITINDITKRVEYVRYEEI